ncbi:MAG: hypothetical protein JST58_00945 [Bacteroidetes bacterium]|nr:hypothetical protein [Bacteroidota bacterium]
MKKCCWLMVLMLLLLGCKGRKISMSGSDKVNADDFVEAFETVKLPYLVSDSVFSKKFNDSSLISYSVFTQFIPDTVISKHFPKGEKPDIYPLARISTEKKENYLVCDAVTDAKELVYLLCLNKENKFIASKLLFAYEKSLDYNSFAQIDNKLTITITHQHHNKDAELKYKKDAYVLTDSGRFMLILTESNEESAKPPDILNPIDTLPRKHKFSGDYIIDKRNLISVRDGKSAGSFLFFVHFEKDNGTCNGELKGKAKFLSANTAQYRGSTDPCTINFSFGNNKVNMKEVDGCGNYRDIKCFFEGTYYKKVTPKPKAIKKKH